MHNVSKTGVRQETNFKEDNRIAKCPAKFWHGLESDVEKITFNKELQF